MVRNDGTNLVIITIMVSASRGTLTARIHDNPASSRIAMMMPPTHMIGAITRMVALSTTIICTCCTSLVLRVMSDGARIVRTRGRRTTGRG